MKKQIRHILPVLSLIVASGAVNAAPAEVVRRVSASEIEAALASKPVEDASAVRNRLGSSFMSAWVSEGKVLGKVLFHDDFSRESFSNIWVDAYAGKGMIRIHDDGRGGRCIFLPPRPKDYNCIAIKPECLVPVDPSRPTAVLWEARQPKGNAPYIEVHFFDENRKNIRGEYQIRSAVDPTQPTIFQRNAELVTLKMPLKTRFLQIIFHHSPQETDQYPGEIDNVRVVDFSDLVDKALLSEEPVKAERAKAGEKDVLVYCDDNLCSSYPVLPKSASVPGRAGDTLKLRECPGEKSRATAVLWSKTAYDDVTVEFSDLKRGPFGMGGAIPASAMSAKVVKVHYQGEGAPAAFVAISDKQVLVPELLLNDDSLVIPDHASGRNLVKCTDEKGSYYVDINTMKPIVWGKWMPCSLMPIVDAKTLQPFSVRAEENKQLMIRIDVPGNAKPGRYRGEIAFKWRGGKIAKLPVELEVLPFRLPETAETIYDSSREYTMGLYVWARIEGDGRIPYYSSPARSREQCLNEFKTLVDYGVTDPAFVWSSAIVFNDEKFREMLSLVREAGFPGKTLHLGHSGHIGSDKDPVKLKAMQQRLRHAMSVAKEYGFDEVFFYGIDEARGAKLLSQIPAWKAARAAGAKVMVSGYSQHYQLVSDYLDLCVYADDAGTADPAAWHAKGARLWKYNTPQAGPEDPNIYRRNYGLDIWKRGFDGANTYCELSSSCWNDIVHVQRLRREKRRGSAYRGLSMVYPTVDGVIATTELSGLESAIKDCRIMTLFRQLLRAKPDAAAQAWFDALKPESDDLVKVRRETIDWILKLKK